MDGDHHSCRLRPGDPRPGDLANPEGYPEVTPWLWALKIGAVGVFLSLVYSAGHRSGSKAVQDRWDASTLKIAQDQTRLLQENAQKVADLVKKQQETNLAVSQDHERALLEIHTKYDADIAAMRASGGLRLPRSVCSASTGAQATGTGGSNEAAAATILLPATTTDDLFDFARRADEVTEIARSCQNWIRSNQFYGGPIPIE